MGGKIEVEEKVEEVKGRASCLALSHKILDLLLCVKLWNLIRLWLTASAQTHDALRATFPAAPFVIVYIADCQMPKRSEHRLRIRAALLLGPLKNQWLENGKIVICKPWSET